jgi:hypothetical protein
MLSLHDTALLEIHLSPCKHNDSATLLKTPRSRCFLSAKCPDFYTRIRHWQIGCIDTERNGERWVGKKFADRWMEWIGGGGDMRPEGTDRHIGRYIDRHDTNR